MDNVVEKKLSELSRGFGTSSGQLIPDTPLCSCTESSNEFDLRRDKTADSLENLFLLRIQGFNESTIEKLKHFDKLRYENEKHSQKTVHKTYSTRGGNLILYAENLYQAKKRKKKNERNVKKSDYDNVIFKGTCEDLADSILKFGNGSFEFLSNSQKFRDERVISVRPGYSPMRYVASASKLWDPGWVDKLLNEKAIKESNLERYRKIELPKIDVIPSSNFDPLLRERPKPYSRISLPDIYFKKKDNVGLVDENDDDDDKLHVDNNSSGYAKSLASDGNLLDGRRLRRKKTMQMNKLQLGMPHEKLPNIQPIEDDDETISDAKWNARKEKSRDVIDRTFEGIREESSQRNSPRYNTDSKSSKNKKIHDDEKLKAKSSRSSSLSSVDHKSFDYASMHPEHKEELISRLLLQGITKEATDVESLISDVSNDDADVSKRRKIDVTDRVSLPTIQGTSISDSQSSKGFKGNALHRGLASANSLKSKSSKDGSIKTSSTSLIVSSVGKLPPIQSQPTTPNVSRQEEFAGEHQPVKLPPIVKRSLKAVKSNRSVAESDDDMSSLFVGGRAIDINDVELNVHDDDDDNNDGLRSPSDAGQGLPQVLDSEDTKRGDFETSTHEQEGAVVQDNLSQLEPKLGHQSPDSGRSTGTGLTTISDAKFSQHENIMNKEPMTPVVEESSRASIASKSLSREGTLNRASGSSKQKSFVSEKSSLKGSSFVEKLEDGLLLIQGLGPEDVVTVANHDDDENLEKMKSDLESREENGEHVNDTASNIAENGEEGLIDEGVVVDEDNFNIQENFQEKDEEDDLQRERTSTDTKTISDSDDIIIRDDNDRESQSGSDHRESEGSFMSSSLLHAQARAAAHSALSRPKSGIDLIEDMKIASVAFGQLFEGSIHREASRSAKSGMGRAASDIMAKTQKSDSKQKDSKRSMSSISMTSEKRMRSVDMDKLKANVSSLESLINKKIHSSDQVMEPKEKSPQDSMPAMGEDFISDKSFTAASQKSDVISEEDIQIDIIGYAKPDKSQSAEQIERRGEVDTAKEQVTALRKEPDTDEELFKMALDAIVDEVKDLKEKKAPKPKKARKVRISDDKYNIIRDRTSASPPFYAGKPKESKAPKGLSRVVEQKKKPTEAATKNAKASGKKGKKKVTKKESKQVDVTKKQDKNSKSGNEVQNVEKESKGDDKDLKSNKDSNNNGNDYDKYDVPITIKTAAEKPKVSSDIPADKSRLIGEPSEVTKHEGSEGTTLGKNYESDLRTDTLSLTETDAEESLIMSSNEDGFDDRVAAARARGRQLAAEKRRLKVEQRRREREEAKKKAMEEAERAEKMRIEGELEKQKRMENYKKQKEQEEEDRLRKEQAERDKLRRLELERDRERREKEELKKKKAAIAAKLKMEEDLRRERERIAREIEAEMRRQEEEKLRQMEEQERLEYERQKKLEEEERLRQEEEKQRLERERRLIEEEELRIKMQKLEEFHRMLLERAKFWEGMKNSKWFLELNQRLTRAFTFSYFDLLPAALFPFTDLRPFSAKEHSSKKLPTIPEEK